MKNEIKTANKTNTTNGGKEMREIKVVAMKKQQILFSGKANANTTLPQVLAFANALADMTDGMFQLSESAIREARKHSVADLRKTLDGLKEAFVAITGCDVDMNKHVKYQNYPEGVMTMSDEELYMTRGMGYLLDLIDMVFGTECRDEWYKQREIIEKAPLVSEDKNIIVLEAAKEDAYEEVIRNLLGAKMNLQDEDATIISEFICESSEEMISKVMPEKIYQKTTLSLVAALMMQRGLSIEPLGIHNAVDAKRLASALSERNIIASGKYYNGRDFKLSNPERRGILAIIDADKYALVNLWGDKESFLRLGECIHPGKYANKYHNAFEAFNKLRKGIKPEVKSVQSRYEQFIATGNAVEAAKVMANLPGKLCQALEQLLALCFTEEDMNKVVDEFENIASLVPTKLLYQCKYHFSVRVVGTEEKVTFDKFRRPITYMSEVAELPEAIVSRVISVADAAWKALLPEREYTKVYFNKEAFASRLVDNVGSRFTLPEGTDVLRFFIYWVGRDIDLSAIMLDEEFNTLGTLDYSNLRTGNCAYHSDDITYAPNGDSEYMDFHLGKLSKNFSAKCKYVGVVAYIYSGHRSYRELKRCFGGFMVRNNINSGEVYEPSTVQMKQNVVGGTGTLLYLIDVETKEVIIVNADVSTKGCGGYNIRSNGSKTVEAIKGIINIEKPNFGDVLSDIFEASGIEIVENKEDAEMIFDFGGDVTPMDDVLMAEYI